MEPICNIYYNTSQIVNSIEDDHILCADVNLDSIQVYNISGLPMGFSVKNSVANCFIGHQVIVDKGDQTWEGTCISNRDNNILISNTIGTIEINNYDAVAKSEIVVGEKVLSVKENGFISYIQPNVSWTAYGSLHITGGLATLSIWAKITNNSMNAICNNVKLYCVSIDNKYLNVDETAGYNLGYKELSNENIIHLNSKSFEINKYYSLNLAQDTHVKYGYRAISPIYIPAMNCSIYNSFVLCGYAAIPETQSTKSFDIELGIYDKIEIKYNTETHDECIVINATVTNNYVKEIVLELLYPYNNFSKIEPSAYTTTKNMIKWAKIIAAESSKTFTFKFTY